MQTGLQAGGQVKGWKIQQIVFVGGTCGSIHVESFNRNIKALGVLESKWDPIRNKLVRRLLEEQDKVLRSYFAQKGVTLSKGRDRGNCKGREHVTSMGPHRREGRGAWGGTGATARAGNMSMGRVCLKKARADRGRVTKS